VRLEQSIVIGAPPEVVFRFFSELDHLRFVTSARRREWCPALGQRLEAGATREVRVQQGRHSLTLSFRTVRLDAPRAHEGELLTWPVEGARHAQRFVPENGGRATRVIDAIEWSPPWYARALIARHEAEQRRCFEEKLENARRLVEAVVARRGAAAFEGGVFADAADAGFAPVVPVG
jgi:ligand-binding SRPBCC domain-containing protein